MNGYFWLWRVCYRFPSFYFLKCKEIAEFHLKILFGITAHTYKVSCTSIAFYYLFPNLYRHVSDFFLSCFWVFVSEICYLFSRYRKGRMTKKLCLKLFYSSCFRLLNYHTVTLWNCENWNTGGKLNWVKMNLKWTKSITAKHFSLCWRHCDMF